MPKQITTCNLRTRKGSMSFLRSPKNGIFLFFSSCPLLLPTFSLSSSSSFFFSFFLLSKSYPFLPNAMTLGSHIIARFFPERWDNTVNKKSITVTRVRLSGWKRSLASYRISFKLLGLSVSCFSYTWSENYKTAYLIDLWIFNELIFVEGLMHSKPYASICVINTQSHMAPGSLTFRLLKEHGQWLGPFCAIQTSLLRPLELFLLGPTV